MVALSRNDVGCCAMSEALELPKGWLMEDVRRASKRCAELLRTVYKYEVLEDADGNVLRKRLVDTIRMPR